MSQPVVVVTGGGRGIGRAICERFASDGAQVVAVARTRNELADVKQHIETAGGKCRVCVADVCKGDEVATLFEETVSGFGRIDVLVNNAGMAPSRPLEEFEPALFADMVSLNIQGVFACCRAAWPVMKKQGGGVIVSISSVASVECYPGFAAYGATKAWVNAWTKGLAEEGRDLGIRAYAVAPGAVETQLLRGTFPDFPAEHTLQPAEVADKVFAVAKPDGAVPSGEIVFVRKE